MRSILCLIILGFSIQAFAEGITLDNIIQINQTSSSGKTLVINKGSNHDFKEKDLGILFAKSIDKNTKKIIYKPVAKLKAVKVFSETSIWISYKVFIASEMVKDRNLLFLEESVLLQGRSDLKIKRSTMVARKPELNTKVKNSLLESEDSLSTKVKNYTKQRDLHDKKSHYDHDINLVDLEVFEDKSGNNKLSSKAIFKSPHAKEFSNRMRVETFEKMVVAFIKKYNDPRFTMQNLYYQQAKDPINGMFPDKVVAGTVYDRYLDKEAKTRGKEEKIYNDLMTKGEGWSDDYSDEELSELVYNIGAIRERERRSVVAAHKFNHQLYANFGLNLVNNENLEDRENTAQSKYDFEFGWEYYFLKDVESLNRFSMEFSFRRAVDAYSIGNGYNATSTEYSAGAHLNWYPFQLSNALETNIIYFGVFLRTGFAALRVNKDNETGNYQVLTLPGFRGGIKYNFRNSYGVRLNGSLENITSSRIVREYDTGVLPNTANYIDGKISFGLSKFF